MTYYIGVPKREYPYMDYILLHNMDLIEGDGSIHKNFNSNGLREYHPLYLEGLLEVWNSMKVYSRDFDRLGNVRPHFREALKELANAD